MDGSNDRQRKDRLIQTRVPQNLESTLKDEARRRRLSVSHLIRNVLEDTFHLVDNVVNEVDRVVADSVGMAQTLRRDAQRLAATARGHTSHRRHEESAAPPPAEAENEREPVAPESEPVEDAPVEDAPPFDSEALDEIDSVAEAMLAVEAALTEPPPPGDSEHVGSLIPSAMPGDAALADVFALQEAVVYRPSLCRRCATPLRRGTRAYLALRDGQQPGIETWLCAECTDALNDEDTDFEA